MLSQEGARLLVLSILEICSGCAAAAGVAPVQLAVVLPFALSFSSFSVIFQLASPLSEQKIPLGPMIASRFVHGLLTELLTAPLLLLWLRTTQTFASGTPVLQADERTVWMTGCLLLLAAFLFLKGEQLFALFTKKK